MYHWSITCSSHRPCSLQHGPHPSGHYGTSLYKKKSWWDVDVIAVWVLLHVWKITAIPRLVIADMILEEQGISKYVFVGFANLFWDKQMMDNSEQLGGFLIWTRAVRTPRNLKLYSKISQIQLSWSSSVAHSMQYMWGALWYIEHKIIKVTLMSGDHDTTPAVACDVPHWTQKKEIFAWCMQITL